MSEEGWGPKAGTYELLTGRITERLVDPLLDAAEAGPGMRVLDVGTGPGYAARRAAERGADATGVDVAEEMLELARRLNGGARFLQADAENLPFEERSLDAVVSHFAVHHVPRPERAIEEFARVARPGGWIAVSSWDQPERNRFLGILIDAVRACGVPGSVHFADDDELRRLLAGAGLEAVEIRSVSLTQQVADADELWDGMVGGSLRTAGLLTRQPADVRERVRTAAGRLAAEYEADGVLAIPASAKIARGRKPWKSSNAG
jgi:ubiquinone/menaquinone biosynthesis C-methylase UbiE